MRSLVLLLGLLLLAPAGGKSPRELIADQTQTVLKTLVEKRAEFRADPAKLEAFIRATTDATFDRTYSARLVLGRHGRAAPPEKVQAFADALAENLLRRYGKAMLEFDVRVDVRVTGETRLRDGRMVRVSSQILREGGPPVPVDYMLHPVGDGWKVFDVIVEGVSYVQTYRTQFEEQLRSQSLDEVIAGLRQGTLRVES
jgi:phospholipid transport system substrate-binding protein